MNLFKMLLIGCLLFTICSSCKTVASESKIQPTNTSFPETNSPRADSCEEVEGTCLELTFDGETCKYEGPNELDPEPITVIFHNKGEGWAAVNLIRLLENKTLDDLTHYIGEEPSTQHQPLWSEHYPGIWKEIQTGETHNGETLLEPGNHAIFCVRSVAWPEPIGVWIGKTWIIGN